MSYWFSGRLSSLIASSREVWAARTCRVCSARRWARMCSRTRVLLGGRGVAMRWRCWSGDLEGREARIVNGASPGGDFSFLGAHRAEPEKEKDRGERERRG